MTGMTAELINAIKRAENILVCGHIRPDGDCIGSALAVRRLCENLGKNADAVCDADKPSQFTFLPDYEYFCAPRFKTYDLFIAVDCATDKRLGVYEQYMLAAKNSINIDHHPTNNKYCKINHIEGDKCSTCAILFGLLYADGLIDKDMATMLYTGLSTDTGHFMHSNTDSSVFEIAMNLCKLGVDVGAVNHDIYCNKSLAKLKLTARALDGIVLYEEGKVALMVIGKQDLIDCGCSSEDTEGLIDYAKSINGVEIAITMCEQNGALFRISLRAVRADVAAAAETFGGGGHKLAAGCMLSGNKYDVIEKILGAARIALKKIQ